MTLNAWETLPHFLLLSMTSSMVDCNVEPWVQTDHSFLTLLLLGDFITTVGKTTKIILNTQEEKQIILAQVFIGVSLFVVCSIFPGPVMRQCGTVDMIVEQRCSLWGGGGKGRGGEGRGGERETHLQRYRHSTQWLISTNEGLHSNAPLWFWKHQWVDPLVSQWSYSVIQLLLHGLTS